jgi:uncharacterized protein (DUF427 family)
MVKNDLAMKPEPSPALDGQESVWDYPRPPRIEASTRHVLVRYRDLVIAETRDALRVLETSLAPSYYLPREVVNLGYLRSAARQTWCEWKGAASYYDLEFNAEIVENVAWSYEAPAAGYEAIRGYLSFYPGVVECFLDDEQVRPQAGGFYGGWISADLVGPFKGEPGSRGW